MLLEVEHENKYKYKKEKASHQWQSNYSNYIINWYGSNVYRILLNLLLKKQVSKRIEACFIFLFLFLMVVYSDKVCFDMSYRCHPFLHRQDK